MHVHIVQTVWCAVYFSYEPHEAPQVRFVNAQHDQLNRCVLHSCLCVCVHKMNFLPINEQFNETITAYIYLGFGSQQAHVQKMRKFRDNAPTLSTEILRMIS